METEPVSVINWPHRLAPWLVRLSNAELNDAFDAALGAYQAGNSSVVRRLDVIHEEITRREWTGQWTEADWRQ